jgi:hypothetical protein
MADTSSGLSDNLRELGFPWSMSNRDGQCALSGRSIDLSDAKSSPVMNRHRRLASCRACGGAT